MSTVINRVTLELLRSVNTPDYPEDVWIINPDLSSVESVARKYWKIDGDLVVEMSAEEKAAYDTANPVVLIKNHLNDGTPCYMYNGIAISTQKDLRIFTGQTSAAGAKNFALTSTLMAKLVVTKNAIIRTVQLAGLGADETTFRITATEGVNSEFKNAALAANTSVAIHDINMLVAAGSTIEVFVAGNKPVVNPVCILEIHLRD